MDNVCRFCLEHIRRRKATSIGNHQFKSMVRQVFPFEIHLNEKLPMKVCGKCFSIVREFHWYSQKVQAVQELLERQFYTAENESSSPVAQAAVDDHARALLGIEEQLGFNKRNPETPSHSYSDVESALPADTQRIEQDFTSARHIDSEICITGCSDSHELKNNIDANAEEGEIEEKQYDEITNNSAESITATAHALHSEIVHEETASKQLSPAYGQRETPMPCSTTQTTEYDQNSEAINDYFQHLSEIVTSETAGWFEDVTNVICEEVPLLGGFAIFSDCSFAPGNESVVPGAKLNEPPQSEDPASAMVFQPAGKTAMYDGTVAHYNEGTNPTESEEMDCGYEEQGGAAMGASLEDLNPSDVTLKADTEHHTDSSMNNPHQTQKFHEAPESDASVVTSMYAIAAGAYIESHQPTDLAKHEWSNGHFENQHEHNPSDLIDHVQEVPYEEEVYSGEAEDQSATTADHATVREVSPERALDPVLTVAEPVFESHSNPAPPATNLTHSVGLFPSKSSGFMDVFSQFLQQQNPPVNSYNNGKTEPESRSQTTDDSISTTQQSASTRVTRYKKYKQKASNELDNAIEKYFDLRCELCPTDTEECFTTFDSLTGHFRKVHETRGYARCCGKQYFYRRQLMEHIDYHRGLLRCSVCDRSFTTRAAMKQHVGVYHRAPHVQYPCTECKVMLNSQNEWVTHQSAVHNTSVSWMQENQDQRVKHCQICGASFTSGLQLKKHMKTHQDNGTNTTRPCMHCSKVFRSEKRLNSHMQLYHPRHPLFCDVCKYSSPSMSLLRKHKCNGHAPMAQENGETTMAQSEPGLPGTVDDGKAGTKRAHMCNVCGFVGSARLLALHSHHQHQFADKANSDDNKAMDVRSVSKAYSSR